ncbi:MAG TPA: ATP-binding cassette domain-containing protein [Chloroflexi bacterium]|nr:ATP-binding cassette domain-containing protein [Chloroflexota bacterium]
MIEVHGLDVRYPEAHALRGVDLSIAPGSFVLIGGPSGGGKSTLAHTLMGLIPQTVPAEVKGHISIAGLDPQRQSVAQLAARVGLVFQNPATQLFNGTVEEEIAFGPRNLNLPAEEIAARLEYALEAAGCAHLRRRAVRHLSGGEQQRVAIAATLAMCPATLILDEPAANLDTEGVQLLVQALVRLHCQYRITLVVIEHRLAPFLPHADRLVWLANGRVVADGTPAKTLARMWPSPPPAGTATTPLPLSQSWVRGNRKVEGAGHPLVTLQGVTAGYDGCLVLQDCSLTLRQGEFAALVGPNGAGKSTLARVLAGLLRPRRGRVVWHVDGRVRRVGFLQQNPLHQLVCDTVEEEVRFGPRTLGVERARDVETVLAQADLLRLRHRPTHALSVGEQQRAALAATLSTRPALLILDEPTVGQDWQHLARMMDFVSDLNRAGQTVLLITHDRRLVERYAGHVWRVADGQAVRQEAGGKRQEANDVVLYRA